MRIVHVCLRVFDCVRVCVRVQVCVCMRMHVRVYVCLYVPVHVRVPRVDHSATIFVPFWLQRMLLFFLRY